MKNLYTIIPKLVIPVYGIAFMFMLLDVQVEDIVSKKRRWPMYYLFAILVVNLGVLILFGNEIFGKFMLLLLYLPLLILLSMISKYKGYKLFFVFLSMVVSCSFPIMIANNIYVYIPSMGLFIQSCIYIIVCIDLLVICHYFFRSYCIYMLENGSNRDFMSFSFMPLICLIYFFLVSGSIVSLDSVEHSNIVLWMPIFICTLSYYLLLTIFKRTQGMQSLQHEKDILNLLMQSSRKYIEELRYSQKQTMIYRHDMRHHLRLLKDYAEAGDLKRMKHYFHDVQQMIDGVTPKLFCKNETANLILSAFSDKAQAAGVTLIVNMDIPSTIALPDTELCALLANGLENAVIAASLVHKENRKVWIGGKINLDKLLLSIENTCNSKVVLENGIPKTEQKGHGFGAKSITAIVKKRSGHFAYIAKEESFKLRVILPLDK